MGIMFEASRLVAIQKLLHGLKMDPLVSLYWFAPVGYCSYSAGEPNLTQISAHRSALASTLV